MELVSALIFDMDGVIVDSTATHTEAWVVYLRDQGMTADNLAARMLGRHNHDLVRDLFAPLELTEEVVIQHGAKKEALYRQMIGPVLEARLVPGIREFLHTYRDTPMAVATNAERANVEFVLEETGLASFFKAVVHGDMVSRPKPFPDVFVTAARRVGYDPRDCVVFEDSLTGIQAARAAGARVVGLSTTMDDLPGVDLTIRDFRDPQLEPWLQELFVSQ